MFTADLTLADRGRFIQVSSKGLSGTDDVTLFGMVQACGHGDPAIELADGYTYHFNDGDTVEFITEEEAFAGTLKQMMEGKF